MASSPAAASTPCEVTSWLTLRAVFSDGKPAWHGPKVRLFQRVVVLIDQCRERGGYPPGARLRLYSGRTRMAPKNLLHDYHSLHDGSTVRVLCEDSGGNLAAVVRASDPRVDVMLSAVSTGMTKGCAPRLTLDGCGGTYLLSSGDGSGPVAVFKPEEEEAGAPRNPRGYVGKMGTQGMKPGVRSGEGAVREVAAAVLDGEDHFAGVPPTALVELEHKALAADGSGGGLSRSVSVGLVMTPSSRQRPRNNSGSATPGRGSDGREQGQLGSLQAFVRSEGVAGDYGASIFPVQEVQKIGARAQAFATTA